MKTISRFSAAILFAAALAGCGQPMVPSYQFEPDEVDRIRVSLKSSGGESSGSGAAAAKATGWAKLKGRFVLDGEKPTLQPLVINKDQAVCTKHPLENEAIVVGSDGGLANVVLYVRARNVEVHPDAATPSSEPVVLDNQGCRFEPHIAVVRTGQPLKIKNSDPVAHNTNATLQTNESFNISIPSGSELEKTLPNAEVTPAPVSCTIHPWMRGYLMVQPHPYVAVSAKDGTFEIDNLPAGVPLEFQLWHESGTGPNSALTLDGGELKTQANGRFTITLQPDEERDLKDVKVPANKLSG